MSIMKECYIDLEHYPERDQLQTTIDLMTEMSKALEPLLEVKQNHFEML